MLHLVLNDLASYKIQWNLQKTCTPVRLCKIIQWHQCIWHNCKEKQLKSLYHTIQVNIIQIVIRLMTVQSVHWGDLSHQVGAKQLWVPLWYSVRCSYFKHDFTSGSLFTPHWHMWCFNYISKVSICSRSGGRVKCRSATGRQIGLLHVH